MRATIIAAIITSPRHRLAILIVARFPSRLSRYRLIAACDGDAGARRRDRAIVLLLVRLGLRVGDVAQLCLTDIEWQTGSLRVCGKSRYEVRLPLPQDVGDTIAAYLECRPSTRRNDVLFLRTIAPCGHSDEATASRRWLSVS
ncbi:tyrosine-type recombinase/integrase [Bradyrhizobium sp. 172]|uniref:tyrosine-type recombinase/integrase n=1 Tax=Bradyrhizobium sp. 172 TaxID=2782643 RepID=UPI002096DAFB|nr:tyrosine-type recombinase/integrase [Bradyrhizobium sp. 172]